jgi:MlaD protein
MTRTIRSLVGLLTLAACLLGLAHLFRLLDPAATRAGQISLHIRFPDAGNLVEGSPVRTRGVQVGEVRSIELTADGTGALVTLAVFARHAPLLRAGSRFWIVRPRFEGITRGVEGLDTLLRNPYVVFDTPADSDPVPVPDGALLVGLDGAPDESSLPPTQPGDLLVSVQFARSFGVDPGAPVVLRDIRVGEVRAVELDSGGQWAAVSLAVRSRYRNTVRSTSAFWIQKPTVQSGWLASNIRASELGSILTGPSVAYFTPEGPSEALQSGAVIRGQLEPPEIPDSLSGPLVYVEPKSGSEATRLAEAAAHAGESLAGISYTFDQTGFLRHRHHSREGSALLLRRSGKLYAATTRTLSDGHYTVSDTFSAADLSGECWKIRGPSGWLSDAAPLWVPEADADFAVLDLKAEVGASGVDLATLVADLDPAQPLQLVAFRGSDRPEFVVLPPHTAAAGSRPGVYPIPPDHAPFLAVWQGALVLDPKGRAVGLLGHTAPLSEQPALVALKLIRDWK